MIEQVFSPALGPLPPNIRSKLFYYSYLYLYLLKSFRSLSQENVKLVKQGKCSLLWQYFVPAMAKPSSFFLRQQTCVANDHNKYLINS